MRTLVVISLILFIAACSASKVAAPSQADVDRGIKEYETLTLSQLESGKELYSANCGKCHPLKNVEKYSKEEWERIMPKMVQKANKKGSNLGAAQEDILMRYAVTMASRP